MPSRRLFLMLTVLLLAGMLVHSSWAQNSTTKVFNSCNGKLSFSYPTDWFIKEMQVDFSIRDLSQHTRNERVDVFQLANQETFFETHILRENLQTIRIEVMPGLIFGQDRITPGKLLAERVFSNNQTTYGTVIEMPSQGRPAARVDFTSSEQGINIDGLQVVMWLPNNYDLWLTAQTTEIASFSTLEATVLSLLDSVTYAAFGPGLPPNGWTTYFEPDCSFKFIYPSDWITDRYFGKVLVFNSRETQANYFGRRPYQPDELAIEILFPGELADYFDNQVDLMNVTLQEVLSAYTEVERLLLIDSPSNLALANQHGLYVRVPNGLVVALNFEGEYIIVDARSGYDSFTNFRETVIQVIDSIQYRPSNG